METTEEPETKMVTAFTPTSPMHHDKVMILVPQKGGTSAAWDRGVINLLKATEIRGYQVAIFWSEEFTIEMARTALVDHALKTGMDWIFFLDSDVRCPPLAIVDLIEFAKREKKEIASGIVYIADKPVKPLAFRFLSMETRDTLVMHPPLIGDKAVFVDVVGFGCCLINTSIFKRLSRPWFVFEGGTEFKNYQEHNYGEDFYFFKKVKLELNKDNPEGMIAVKGDLHTVHEKKVDFTWQEYERSVVEMHGNLIQLAEDIQKFSGEGTTEEIYKQIKDGMGQSSTVWQKYNPQTDEEIRNFYVGEPSKVYLPELVIYDALNRAKRNDYMMSVLKQGGPFLDYGAGIGLLPYRVGKLLECYHADLPGYPFKFAQFRAKKDGLNINFLNVEEYPWENKYEGFFNSITCIDVLEHIKDPRPVMDRIVKLLKPNGMLILQVADSHYGGRKFNPHISDMNQDACTRYLQEKGMSTANGTHFFKCTTVMDLLNSHWRVTGEY